MSEATIWRELLDAEWQPGSVQILETTLRDGSYVIDFQFTEADTVLISRELECAGVRLIEVGHGIGLGASEAGMGRAAESDETYLRCTAEALNGARWGMFCIPGIAKLESIAMAADHGMHFIRIGTNVTEVEESEPFIVEARQRGIFVTANFMKSYAMAPQEFAKKVKLSEEFGSQLVYLVDSAGGMLPEEVERYFSAVREVSDVPMGFHGHDNLGLAIANSLKAMELGACIVDSSLQGLGRSAGNASTEVLVAALSRRSMHLGIDLLRLMDVGEEFVRPLLQRSGYDSVDVITGYAQFHSSYMGIIREYATKYRIDPRRLIVGVCEEDKVNAPPDLVDRVAARLRGEHEEEVFTARFRLDRYHGAEQDPDR